MECYSLKKLVPLFLSLGLISCSDVDTKDVAWTTSNDDIHFSNEKFKMSIVKPKSWYAQNVKELVAMQHRGMDIMSGSDENLEAILEASLKTSLPLFGFHEFTPGTPTTTNSSLMGVAENISALPGIKSGCDYLYHAKQLIKQAQVKVEFEDECLSQEINGVNISYFNSQMAVGTNTVKQKYMACLSGDYAIAVVHTVVNKENTSEIDGVLNTLKVQCNT
tara:strand:+ start:597 stop:1256 length:660 start_codon:yes stop_codon:yes gene_type:complete